jgi:mono/diheme cytochrome c family protein
MWKTRKTVLAVTVALAAAIVVASAAVLTQKNSHDAPAQRVDFNRDIRPIFNGNCIACHGGVKQAGDVSFSYREQVLGKGKSGRPTVVPGSPRGSELMARVTSNNPETRMPLHGPPLKPEQIALLRQWIEEGAAWENYWAFVPPKPQALPAVRQAGWVRQPLDRFILARLEKESLSPAPEADKPALLRRVSLDLTGMPPTPDELAAFLADTSKGAYERQVDRLLASKRYGERWAAMWLDLARYGDTKGFEKDKSRPGVWIYRDWVIEALNQNMPYDAFVIKQLAGDLLPNPTLEDRIATAFHRQTASNDEGGTDDEEFRIAAVMDRAATTWSVLGGVSFNCVQCHSHPYDPIRNSEYYKFLAIFNTARDSDIAFSKSLEDDWPLLHLPVDKTKRAEWDRLQRESDKVRADVVAASRALVDRTTWKILPIQKAVASEILALERTIAELRAQPASKGRDQQLTQLRQRLFYAKKEKEKTFAAGFRIQNGMAESTGTVPIGSVFDFEAAVPVSAFTALRFEVPPANAAKARHSPERGFVVNKIEVWAVPPGGAPQKVDFRFLAPDSAENLEGNVARMLRNMAKGTPQSGAMTRLADNSGFMANSRLFYTRWVVAVPSAAQTLAPGTVLKVRFGQTESINAAPAHVPRIRIFASNDARWTQMAHAPATAKNIANLERLARHIRDVPSLPLPVMVEQAGHERRHTLAFERGSFLNQVGPALAPDTPAVFPRMSPGAPRNRLTTARWFFDPKQPLTARVAVNRYWEQLFGTGIVESLEDFGSAGEMPSHPELLDWLALHFQNDLRWNMKALVRELVTSATYRQSARTVPALRDKDPRNRLLGHGPAQRLSAEMVRDQALLASGLLNPQMGGPPVMPLQPDGVWNVEANNPERWLNATGSDRYRRAMYTFIKRTAIYPSFTTFDAADRQLSVPRRLPTNTPLQALVTLNDPVYQQAAEALAARMVREAPRGPSRDPLEAQLNHGGRWVLSRNLTATEIAALRKLHGAAGMTAVASALLNLDAAFTR